MSGPRAGIIWTKKIPKQNQKNQTQNQRKNQKKKQKYFYFSSLISIFLKKSKFKLVIF
jgi:hypothetical protein